MQEIVDLINGVGFPIAMCLGFGWYMNKKDNQRIEIEKETKANEIEERKKLVESIELYRITSNKLLETNKELSETNRIIVSDITSRLNIMENTLIDINNKL